MLADTFDAYVSIACKLQESKQFGYEEMLANSLLSENETLTVDDADAIAADALGLLSEEECKQ